VLCLLVSALTDCARLSYDHYPVRNPSEFAKKCVRAG
jgi:hypothetical protein